MRLLERNDIVKTFVPTKQYQCYVLYNSDIIRAYESTNQNAYNRYHDYYIHDDYLEQIGYQYNYNTNYECIDKNLLSEEIYYRLDFDRILIIFFCLAFVGLVVPFKLFMKLFKRGSIF